MYLVIHTSRRAHPYKCLAQTRPGNEPTNNTQLIANEKKSSGLTLGDLSNAAAAEVSKAKSVAYKEPLEQTNKQLAQTNQQLAQTNQQLAQTNQQLTQTNQQLTQTNQQLTQRNDALERQRQASTLGPMTPVDQETVDAANAMIRCTNNLHVEVANAFLALSNTPREASDYARLEGQMSRAFQTLNRCREACFTKYPAAVAQARGGGQPSKPPISQ